jgi:hypothetical protein
MEILRLTEDESSIIAITGLNGHVHGLWQGRENLGRMWLRDFLWKDLPQCRTVIYGYNSKPSSHGVDTILDLRAGADVYQWLCDAQNGRWMMVLDNADDDGIFSSSKTSDERGPLGSFLPQAAHGSILITTRDGRAARNLVGRDGNVIETRPMNEEESLTLLQASIPAP